MYVYVIPLALMGVDYCLFLICSNVCCIDPRNEGGQKPGSRTSAWLRSPPWYPMPFYALFALALCSQKPSKTAQEAPTGPQDAPRRALQEPKITHTCPQHFSKIAPGYPSWDGPLGSSLILGLDKVSRWNRPGVKRTKRPQDARRWPRRAWESPKGLQ